MRKRSTSRPRVPAETQAGIAQCTADSAQALGLAEGPVHAELRLNEQGAWLVEMAGRSIGGLCSQTLRFAHSADVSLKDIILRQALGLDIDALEREDRAGGVMMIPIPEAGLLRGVSGLEEAKAVTGIEDVQITAKLNYPLVPLPEGESYLGFMLHFDLVYATLTTSKQGKPMSAIVNFLKQGDIFYQFTPTQLELVANLCQEVIFNAGDIIFRENSGSKELYVIAQGEVDILIDPLLVGGPTASGQETVIATLRRGHRLAR